MQPVTIALDSDENLLLSRLLMARIDYLAQQPECLEQQVEMDLCASIATKALLQMRINKHTQKHASILN